MLARIHQPYFPDGDALFIIWAETRDHRRVSVAAGCFAAMDAAWSAVQDRYPDQTLWLQERARVLDRRAPLR